ncbi:MAG: 50S ribosomal protein L24 [Acidobacteria bacterium]|nr:50S ribosomal protein L24 [Acidobacteriota bacterium]MCI0722627.1 50S ribosomal protein L24 [Acidobacteriota bacterium]
MAERVRIQVRKNDQVKVIAGKDLNKTGRVLRVLRDKGRVVVEGVSFLKRHTRPNPQRQIKGGIVEKEAPIHVSNVMIVCGACGKATRIGHNVLADGKKVRICRSCNSSLDK